MEPNGPFDEQPQESGAIETTSQENFGMGVLGAFLGSLVGVVVIIVLSRLGIIAAVSGLVMRRSRDTRSSAASSRSAGSSLPWSSSS